MLISRFQCRSGNPHEKIDSLLLERLRQVLEPVRTEAEHEAELDRDRESTWFGFDRDSSGHPTFVDYGRFAAIMTESLAGKVSDIFPQLVSFIGETGRLFVPALSPLESPTFSGFSNRNTGAGKSTLIKLLIDRQDLSPQGAARYWAPVTSSTQDYIPTTGDVHLYADPSSFCTKEPLLFADCEGLNGGEALPKALRRLSRPSNSNSSPSSSSSRDTLSTRRGQTPLTSVYGSHRSILWAKTLQTRKREYAIQHLYPKVLYTFSDVVVFVMRNPRSFESTVLNKLIHWGATSLDISLNQPVLPHAIIVINATDNMGDTEWETGEATEKLMAAIDGAISREPELQKYIQTWKEHGKTITNTKQLLECYYSSIIVIRIPARGSYLLLDRQVEKLARLVKARCAESHTAKRRVRLLADAERTQVYLQSAFDQFTRDIDSPFDFVKESLRQNPVPRNLEGNILRLAISIKDNAIHESLRNDAKHIFLTLAPMVASCIMFDAARQNLLGTAPQLLKDAYSERCTAALRSFAHNHWPCTFTNHLRGKTPRRCCNIRSGHAKGHQDIHRKVIGTGSYQESFELESLTTWWIEAISDQLVLFQNAACKFLTSTCFAYESWWIGTGWDPSLH
jgi:hypothetical protein